MDTKLLKHTFDRAAKENGGLKTLGMNFYARLFTKYPQVRPLFKTPPEIQHKKLIASLGAILAGVEHPETLLPFLHAMGIRHLKYGTENGHYAAVAENLIAVLADHLCVEGEWTEEMAKSWSEAMDFVSKIMIEAADNPVRFAEELAGAGYESDGFKNPDGEKQLQANVT